MAEDELEPLVTECPNCSTRFRVTETQLQVAAGRVRCGACLTVFQGIDHLLWDAGHAFANADEATSALDTESEAYIQQAMDELSKNRTTIIIAHRLSTVKNVDSIFVLRQGEIIETGTHGHLIQNNGYYYTFIR